MDYTDSLTLEGHASQVSARVKASLIDPDNGSLHKSVHSVLNDIGKKHSALRPDILKLMNTFSSVRDELSSGMLSKAGAAAVLNPVVLSFKARVADYISSSLDSTTKADAAADIPRQMGSYGLVRSEVLTAIEHNKIWLGSAPIIPQLKQGKWTQVKRTGGPAQPIDVINAISYNMLAKHGVPSTSLGGYTVLTKEKVLVIPRDYIHSLMKNPELKPSEWTSRHRDEAEGLYAEIVESALSKFPRYEVIEVTSAWRGARCYWLITPGELAILRKCSGGAFALTRWSFAFGDA